MHNDHVHTLYYNVAYKYIICIMTLYTGDFNSLFSYARGAHYYYHNTHTQKNTIIIIIIQHKLYK